MTRRAIKVKDESGDRKYFVITPQLVWALSRDNFDMGLWYVVKMIAGDDGECYLSTEELAILAMMSVGKLVDCRTYLLEQGLLEGEIRKDPGYPQPVWHLRVPNLWPANITWRDDLGHALKGRISYKKQQKAKRLHQVKASSDVGGPIPGEGKPSPGEAKENHKEEPKGEGGGLVLFQHAGIEVEI